MSAPGEYQLSFNVPDVNPYVHPDMTWANQQGMIVGGGYKDSSNTGGYSKLIYDGDLIRPGYLYSYVELGESGSIWNDGRGPALWVKEGANKGKGYCARVHGNEIRLQRHDSESGTETTLGSAATGLTFAAGDIIHMRQSSSGYIQVYHNDEFILGSSDTMYRDEVCPGVGIVNGNSGATKIVSFGCDGLAATGVAPSWNGTPSPPLAYVGVAYTYDFSALLDGDDPMTVVSIATDLPDGLSVSGKTITGTPTGSGTTSGIALNATNSGGGEDSPVFDLTVNAAVVPISWDDVPSPPLATVGVAYNYDFDHLVKGDRPYVASLNNGTLPAGLDVINEAITGTPTAEGTQSSLQLKAQGSTNAAYTSHFSLTVEASSVTLPAISNINGDDHIQSLEDCLAAGTNLDTVTDVRIGSVVLPFVIVNPTNIAFECPDLHLLPYRSGEQCTVSFYTAHGHVDHAVTLLEQAGNTTIQVTAIETNPDTPGLLYSIPGAAVGGFYEGQLDIGGSAATYETDGPHRNLQPAVPAGTTSTGFYFNAVSREWTQINEVTNPPATTTPIELTDILVTATDNTVGTEVTSTDVAGNGFVSLRTDRQWLDSDIPAILAGTVGGGIVAHKSVAGALNMTALFPGQAFEQQHYVAWVQDSGDGRTSNMVTGTIITGGAPAVPAVLTGAFTGLVGGAFGSVGCDSNLARGTLHLACYLTSVKPPPETLKSGAGSEAFTRVGVYKDGKQGPYALVGLAENTQYYYWMVQDSDGNGMYSNQLGGTFTTTAGPSPLPDDLIGTKSDTMANALKLQGFSGNVNDMLLAWGKSLGGTGGQLNDVLLSGLQAQTGGAGAKTLPDAWFSVLRAHGFVGARPEMEHAFWAAGGALVEDPAAPPPDPELPNSLDDLVLQLRDEGWDAILFPPDAIKVDDFDGWVTLQEAELADGSYLYRTDVSNPLKADIQQWIDAG